MSDVTILLAFLGLLAAAAGLLALCDTLRPAPAPRDGAQGAEP